jgi:uracil-DNA glycosylase
MPHLADRLIATLPESRPGLYNPYIDGCSHDSPTNAAAERVERLRQHLDCSPKVILVGEAPGYQGCRYSGVAFTSERLLVAGSIPRIPALTNRLTTRRLPFSEPSATIVWRVLEELGAEADAVLWNAVQLHPHQPGRPWSNRRPRAAEIAIGVPALELLRRAFPKATLVPVGQKADGILKSAGIRAAPCVRHPANGGAVRFAEELRALLA